MRQTRTQPEGEQKDSHIRPSHAPKSPILSSVWRKSNAPRVRDLRIMHAIAVLTEETTVYLSLEEVQEEEEYHDRVVHATDACVHEEQKEILCIARAHAVVHPGAVMVHSEDALSASSAVVRPEGVRRSTSMSDRQYVVGMFREGRFQGLLPRPCCTSPRRFICIALFAKFDGAGLHDGIPHLPCTFVF